MVRVSPPAKLRPWSELTAKMVVGVVPGLVNFPWKLKDENLQLFCQIFAAFFARLLQTFSRTSLWGITGTSN